MILVCVVLCYQYRQAGKKMSKIESECDGGKALHPSAFQV